MTINARTAEILTTSYLRTLGNDPKEHDPGDDSSGSAAVALFKDLLTDAHEAGMEPEVTFDFGVILGVDVAIAACTLPPEAALKKIAEYVKCSRGMLADWTNDGENAGIKHFLRNLADTTDLEYATRAGVQ